METLVDKVLSLEKEADAILAKAGMDAEEIARKAEADASAYRQKMAEEMSRRLTVFRKQAEEKHAQALAEAEAELRAGLEALDRLPALAIEKAVNRIVSRFREW